MTMIYRCGAKGNATSIAFIGVDSEQATWVTFCEKVWVFESLHK